MTRFENSGLKIIAAKLVQLSQADAEGFYAVHRERPFFADLVKFMISGPVFVQVLEGEGAVLKNRDLMGATDPKKPMPVLSVLILPRALMPMPCMVAILLKMRRLKLLISSRLQTFTAVNFLS